MLVGIYSPDGAFLAQSRVAINYNQTECLSERFVLTFVVNIQEGAMGWSCKVGGGGHSAEV